MTESTKCLLCGCGGLNENAYCNCDCHKGFVS